MKKNLLILCFIAIFVFSYSQKCSALNIKSVDKNSSSSILRGEEDIRFIFVFTSWCPACKSIFGEVLSLYELYAGNERVKIIMLSLDNNKSALKKFSNQFANKKGVIYSVEGLSKSDVSVLLHKNRIDFRGRIPHMTLFHNDQMIGSDLYEIDSVHKMIEFLLSKK